MARVFDCAAGIAHCSGNDLVHTLADALQLENVVRIRGGGTAVIAERRDGSYTLCGGCAESGNYGSTASWKSVVDYDIGDVCAAAIEENNTLRTTGSNRAKQ